MRKHETLKLSHILSVTKHEMRRQMDSVLRPLGLTAAQYSALSALEEKATQTNADLARACFVTPQTMIRMVKEFRRKAYIKRSHTEGLKIRMELSPKAFDILCRAHRAIDSLEREMTKGLSKAEVKRLMEMLINCLDNLAD